MGNQNLRMNPLAVKFWVSGKMVAAFVMGLQGGEGDAVMADFMSHPAPGSRERRGPFQPYGSRPPPRTTRS